MLYMQRGFRVLLSLCRSRSGGAALSRPLTALVPRPRPVLSPAEDMRGRIEAETSSSTLEEEFPPDLLEKTRGDKKKKKTETEVGINAENARGGV